MTGGLVVAGAMFGGVAGSLALGIALAVSEGLGSLTDLKFLGVAALIGAAVGAVAAPIAGWLLLRHVPLGRAFMGLTVGTVIGGAIGVLARVDSVTGIVGVGAVGFLVAAVVLRLRARHQRLDEGAA